MSTVIAGVDVFHPRTEWEQVGWRIAQDFTRLPTGMTIGRVDTMVAHYTGAKNVPDGDPGEDMTSMRDYLRAIERDYLTNRTGGGYTRRSDGKWFPGYHTGYSFAVDWQGGVWEIRGFDFLPAATNQHNDHTVAVLFFVDGPDAANAAMWASARAIGRETRMRSAHPDFRPVFTDHGTLTITSGVGTPTACAGPGIRPQLATEGNIDMEDEMAVRYFKVGTNPDNITIYATPDGLNAYRLDPLIAQRRGVDPFKVQPITAGEAGQMMFWPGGLPVESVR